jgi:predicted transcriptional regulator
MADKFIITKKSTETNDKSVTFTIRIDRELQERYDDLALKSERSRNELISLAMKYALENLEFVEGSKAENTEIES